MISRTIYTTRKQKRGQIGKRERERKRARNVSIKQTHMSKHSETHECLNHKQLKCVC